MFSTEYLSTLGKIILASDSQSLVGLWFEDQKYFGALGIQENNDIRVFSDVKKWLDWYFLGKNQNITFNLALKGGAFRQTVWRFLLEIPYGKVTTYGEISEKLFKTKIFARAIGGAVAHNPISIIIPCHRVVGTKGLTGYAGGINRKIKLLKLEKAI